MSIAIEPGDRVEHIKTDGRIRGRVVRTMVEVVVDGVPDGPHSYYDAGNLRIVGRVGEDGFVVDTSRDPEAELAKLRAAVEAIVEAWPGGAAADAVSQRTLDRLRAVISSAIRIARGGE